MQIFAIQDRQIKSHLLALQHVANDDNVEITYLQFSILRPTVANIYKGNFRNAGTEIRQAVLYVFTLFRSPFIKKSIVVLGMAPFDWRLLLLTPFLLKHDVYFHNSWPYWGPHENSPKSKFFGATVSIWRLIIPRLATGFLCVSPTTAASIKKHFPNWPDTHIVGHTIEATQFLNLSDVSAKLYQKSVCYLGRMVKEKGIEDLVELAENLPSFTFHFVGDGPMLQQVQQANLTNVTCHGFVSSRDARNEILDKCSFIAQPSKQSDGWTEAFGIGVLEGMARGLIPITTNTPGSLSVLGEGLNSLAFNTEKYVESFKTFALKLDPEAAAELRKKCFKRSLAFSPEAVSRIWRKVFADATPKL